VPAPIMELENEELKEEETLEIRVLIENQQVGGIIGKQGANVRRVREETGVFLSILKVQQEFRNVQERVMVVKGTNSQIAKAIHLTSELLIEAANRDKKGETPGPVTDSTAVRVLVHRSAVGAVIGKQGAVIKETQSETGARVQVSNDPLPNSTEKTVTITGTPSSIHQATIRILSQLKESPVRSNVKSFPYVPGQPMYPQPPFGMPQYPMQVPQGYGAPQPMAPPPQHGSSSPYGVSMPAATNTQKIAIPTVCAGCVIGKGGSVIRDLRQQSGTNISIADPDTSSPNERVVTLTGSSQGIQMAIYLIRNLVEQYQPQQQY